MGDVRASAVRPARTLSVSLASDPKRVYEFLADPANLPAWASGLCTSIARSGDAWVAETRGGPMTVRFVERNALGVLDHYVTAPDGKETYVPLRVIANGGGSEVMFTLLRSPEMSEEDFARDALLVEQDLNRLRALLEA